MKGRLTTPPTTPGVQKGAKRSQNAEQGQTKRTRDLSDVATTSTVPSTAVQQNQEKRARQCLGRKHELVALAQWHQYTKQTGKDDQGLRHPSS
jgi:hypothetical protein